MSRSAAVDRAAGPSAPAQREPDAPSSTRRGTETAPRIVAVGGGDLARAVAKDRPPPAEEPGAERLSQHTGGDGWANQCHHATR